MFDRDVEDLARYVRTIANMVGLRDYTVEVAPETPSDGKVAECITEDGRASVALCFAGYFERLPPEEQRHAVVHELLHVHFARPAATISSDMREFLSETEHRLAWAAYKRQVEHSVDTLATAIADLLPLPTL